MQRDYMKEAQAEFEERQRREVEKIAQELRELDEWKATKEKQKTCSHPDYYIGDRSEHYAKTCTECGKDLG